MDTPEHGDQVLQKLSSIESQLRSLRYTFGIGIIVLAIFLTLLAPSLVKDLPTQNTQQATEPAILAPAEESDTSVAETPAATTTTTP
jgi:hypothetical protein